MGSAGKADPIFSVVPKDDFPSHQTLWVDGYYCRLMKKITGRVMNLFH